MNHTPSELLRDYDIATAQERDEYLRRVVAIIRAMDEQRERSRIYRVPDDVRNRGLEEWTDARIDAEVK